MAFGVLGTCRGVELTNLIVDNVKDTGEEIVVKVPDTKTNKTKKPKIYIINGEFTNIVREYVKLRPKNSSTNRFFLQYRNGKLTNQPMGKHSIAKIPKEMATFLQLPDPHTYTGHSYRRTSTTIAADAGASIEDLKRLGQWKSTDVVEKYIENSLGHRRKLANLLSGAINLPSTSTSTGDTSNASETECDKKTTPTSVFVQSSTQLVVSDASGRARQTFGTLGAAEKKETFGILGAPEKKENVIFNFAGECSNFTINYYK